MLFGKRKQVVKRILVVEDEPLTAFDNENMLTDAGYHVVATLDTLAAALESIKDDDIDLILSDVRLSGDGTGVELAKAAREKNIPVVFVTGAPPEGCEEMVLGCLLKPYTDRTMRAALKAVDQHLQGQKSRPPKGLTLYGANEPA